MSDQDKLQTLTELIDELHDKLSDTILILNELKN